MDKKTILAEMKRLKVNDCGECTLCCTLPQIVEKGYEKDSYETCKHCELSVGCKIYEERPETCMGFMCLYSLGMQEDRPSDVGFFVFIEHELSFEHKALTVYCETDKVGGLSIMLKTDKELRQLLIDGWTFVVRYNKNQHDKIIITNTEERNISDYE